MRVVSPFNGIQSNNISISDILSRLNAGDILRAQVIDIAANEVLLKLFDGTTFSASSKVPVAAQKGEFVNFFVKEKSDSQIFLETVKNTSVNNGGITENFNDMKAQLQSIGMKPTEKNLDILREMATQQIPLTKESFSRIVELGVKFAELDASKAAYMVSKNILPEEKNIEFLSRFLEGKIKIGSEISQLIEILEPLTDGKEVQSLKNTSIPTEQNSKDTTFINKEAGIGKNIPSNGERTTAHNPDIQPLKPSNMSASSDGKNLIIQRSDFEILMRNQLSGIPKNSDISGSFLGKLPDVIMNSAGKGLNPENVANFLMKELPEYSQLSSKDQKLFSDVFIKFLKEVQKQPHYENNYQDSLAVRPEDSTPLKEALSSLKDIFVKINSEHLKDEIKPGKIYNELYQRLEALKESMETLPSANRNEILNKIDNLQNSLQFMNNIYNHSAYVQIPLKLWDNSSTGDLFVLKRDAGRRKLDAGNITVLLSLDTQNIGQVDTLLSVDKKNVNNNMRVGDEALFEMIRDSHKDLFQRMAENGYKLVELKYRLREEDINLLNVKEISGRMLQENRTSIDMRL